jgi:uncharacterized protein YfaS (alpha-2-macroglobulin family)
MPTPRFEAGARRCPDGKPQPAEGLKVTLVREHRDYHWNYDEDGGWDYDFTRRFENVEVRTLDAGDRGALRFPGGVGRIPAGRVRSRDHWLTTRYPFHAGWSWDDANRGLDARPDKVKLALDKTGYKRRRHAEGDGHPAACGQGPADGGKRPHAVRAGDRREAGQPWSKSR